MIEERLRIAQLELQEAAAHSFRLLAQYRLPANEVAETRGGLFCLYGKAKTRLQHMILIGDVMDEVAGCLLDPARIEGMQPTEPQAMRFSVGEERVKSRPRHLAGNVECPAELPDVGNAVGPRHNRAELDFLQAPEGKGLVGEVRSRDRLQERSRVRPHQAQNRFPACHVEDD